MLIADAPNLAVQRKRRRGLSGLLRDDAGPRITLGDFDVAPDPDQISLTTNRPGTVYWTNTVAAATSPASVVAGTGVVSGSFSTPGGPATALLDLSLAVDGWLNFVLVPTGSSDPTAIEQIAVTFSSGAIVYVGGMVSTQGGGTSPQSINYALTGGTNSVPQAGDFVFVLYGAASVADINLSVTGFTEIADLFNNRPIDTNLGAYWKVMPATPDTAFEISSSGSSSNRRTAAVMVFRNVNATPIGASANASGTATQNGTPPALAATAGNLVLGMVVGTGAGSTAYSSSDYDVFRQGISASGTNRVTVGLGYKLSSGGTFTPAAFTGGTNDANDGWLGYSVEIVKA